MNKINILGINISAGSRSEILAKIQEFLANDRQHFIITPNPEIILAAVKDQELFDIINEADLAIPDGVGLKLAGWLAGENLHRLTGADLLKEILALAEAQGRRVAILNWQSGLSSVQDIKQSLAKNYPGLKFIAINLERQTAIPEPAKEQAREFMPEIIFCTLGAPYQEKFIFQALPKLPSVRIAMGVGGAFDFLTGRIIRAPKILRAVGLEWLWRLIKQPWRWRRIYNAVIVFPLKFILWRLKMATKIIN